VHPETRPISCLGNAIFYAAAVICAGVVVALVWAVVALIGHLAG
jgi:hypothetical protein